MRHNSAQARSTLVGVLCDCKNLVDALNGEIDLQEGAAGDTGGRDGALDFVFGIWEIFCQVFGFLGVGWGVG